MESRQSRGLLIHAIRTTISPGRGVDRTNFVVDWINLLSLEKKKYHVCVYHNNLISKSQAGRVFLSRQSLCLHLEALKKNETRVESRSSAFLNRETHRLTAADRADGIPGTRFFSRRPERLLNPAPWSITRNRDRPLENRNKASRPVALYVPPGTVGENRRISSSDCRLFD